MFDETKHSSVRRRRSSVGERETPHSLSQQQRPRRGSSASLEDKEDKKEKKRKKSLIIEAPKNLIGPYPIGAGVGFERSVNYIPVYPNATFPGAGGQYGFRRGGVLGGSGFGLGGGYYALFSMNMHFLTTALKNLEPRIDDDFIDRLNYYYTPSVIIIFAILVSAKQYVGHPIECWVPAQFTKAMEQYTENYCWIQNTYWVPFLELIPRQLEERSKRQIGYYQWVPFILAIQALLFYCPALVWRLLSSQSGINVHGILQMACDDHNIEPDNRIRSIEILSRHIDDALQYQRDYGTKEKHMYLWACVKIGKIYGCYVSILYCCVKLLYVLNCLGQFFLLNRFLETQDYPYFGAHVLWDMMHGIEWQNSGKFPRVTLCDFEIRVLGNIHRHTVQCCLVINMFTEKIFVFLWLWFLLLAIVDSASLGYWLTSLGLPVMRAGFIRKHLELADNPPHPKKDEHVLRNFVLSFLRPDGVFVLRMIQVHAGTVMCSEISHALWTRSKLLSAKSKRGKLPSSDSEESITLPKLAPIIEESETFTRGTNTESAYVLPMLTSAFNPNEQTPVSSASPEAPGKVLKKKLSQLNFWHTQQNEKNKNIEASQTTPSLEVHFAKPITTVDETVTKRDRGEVKFANSHYRI